ncbi:MAG: hypothetical protein WCJ42_06355 [Actinomycetes bacterium]
MGLSGIWRPVGPDSALTYWLRRAIIVAMLLVLAAAGYWSVRPSGHPKASHPLPTVSALPSGSASPSVAAIRPCSDSSLKIVATTDAASYPAGSSVQLQLGLQNIGKVACRRDVGGAANTFTVTSGGYATWANRDCLTPTGHSVRVLKPKAVVQVNFTWQLQRSLHGCPTLVGKAKPGYYDLVVGNGGLLSNSAPFSIG